MSSTSPLGHFSRLPPEIRDQIYDEVIFPFKSRPSGYAKWWCPRPQPQFQYGQRGWPTFPWIPICLSLNTTIRAEALAMFFRHIYLGFHTHDIRASDHYFKNPDTLSVRARVTKLDIETSTELSCELRPPDNDSLIGNPGADDPMGSGLGGVTHHWTYDKIYPEQDPQHLSMYKIQWLTAAFPNLRVLCLRIWIRFHLASDTGISNYSKDLIDGRGALQLLHESLRPVIKGLQMFWISPGSGAAYTAPRLKRKMLLGDPLLVDTDGSESESWGSDSDSASFGVDPETDYDGAFPPGSTPTSRQTTQSITSDSVERPDTSQPVSNDLQISQTQTSLPNSTAASPSASSSSPSPSSSASDATPYRAPNLNVITLHGIASNTNRTRPVLYSADPCAFLSALRRTVLTSSDAESALSDDTFQVLLPGDDILEDIKALRF